MNLTPLRAASGLLVLFLSTLCSVSALHAQTLPDAIAKSKTIKVAVNSIYPPMEYKDPDSGELTGFDIDLGNAIAKELGVKLEWQESAFEQLLPSLTTGRVDMILSGMSDLPKRRDSVDFLDYVNSGAQFYILASRAGEIRSATDLCGKSVGTSRSTSFPADTADWSAQHCVAAGKPAITVVGTEDTSSARMQLKQTRIAAGVQGSETLPYAMKLEPNTYKPIGEPFATSPEGIAFAKSNPKLRDAVLAALNRLVANGTYRTIVAKWGLQSSAVAKIGVNGVTPQ
ncbi:MULTISPECIES: ABC transporter substrate-binding protein [Paraburkholderia]|uniref:ABC transporter substrate-binding protein n=1 Tax=Paraburkholderia TaxID=1822464 RepID=UPI0022517751|nr:MULTISPECIES: ABC transporter substrate-binding protein [Paraburkholderia]MCX4161601.1 ABC transporter substrate-binding protein [Paraburkholderia megapolitana]MDN7157097.1 ABC transporter substrate-binding protein [Paraburkholderia sp. CHISQ3]MDQ6494142.1 ABC transporter substrate-binding protein [Paraburkholderia megapolitana]